MEKLTKWLFLIAVLISFGFIVIQLLHHTQISSFKIVSELNQAPEVKELMSAKNIHPDKAMMNPWVTEFGWQVKIRSLENANEVMKALIVAGFPAYVQREEEDGKTLMTVVIGPHVRKQDAEKLRETLQENFKLNGVVVRYDPA